MGGRSTTTLAMKMATLAWIRKDTHSRSMVRAWRSFLARLQEVVTVAARKIRFTLHRKSSFIPPLLALLYR
uniref:Uncharacterized protein n=1 Tax=Oryza brachyantha TaxID=4533 RepID=J3MF16_ORYBR